MLQIRVRGVYKGGGYQGLAPHEMLKNNVSPPGQISAKITDLSIFCRLMFSKDENIEMVLSYFTSLKGETG